MSDDAPAERHLFNPHQIRVLRFTQAALDRRAGDAQTWRYEVTLALSEAQRDGLEVSEITLTAEGFSIEPLRQIEVLDLMLDAVTEALARERAGIRPGTPSPEGLAHLAPRRRKAG